MKFPRPFPLSENSHGNRLLRIMPMTCPSATFYYAHDIPFESKKANACEAGMHVVSRECMEAGMHVVSEVTTKMRGEDGGAGGLHGS